VEKLFHFKAHFKETLALALAVYPEAKALLAERGITLYPSPKPADLGQLRQG